MTIQIGGTSSASMTRRAMQSVTRSILPDSLANKLTSSVTLSTSASATGADGIQTNDSSAQTGKKKLRGSIMGGIALGVVGSALVAGASIGFPAVAALGTHAVAPVAAGLLNNALRFCGVVSFMGANASLRQGNDHTVVRGAVLTAYGALGMLSACGVFGHIGGATAVCMGIGGFLTTLSGISKLGTMKAS